MTKITQIQTPFGGGKITSLGTWGSIIGSVVVTIIAVAVGQNLARKAQTASGGRIDATIDPIFSQPSAAPKAKPII
jgi:uncharacterized membrane protein